VQRLVAAASLIVVLAWGAFAQVQTLPTKFDVATIKPNATNDDRFALIGLPGGGLSATGVTLKMLIMDAYNVKAFQVSGEPAWVDTARWDVEAKVAGVQQRLSQVQTGPMLRALLEDRFQLRIRRESKEMPVYALVVGKAGSKLTLHTGEPPPPGQGIRQGRGMFSVKKGSIAPLTRELERQLARVVIDRTGLMGDYDYTLEWTPEPGQGGRESLGLPPQSAPAAPAAPSDSKGPSIFTALQEQLGLKLDSEKGPVEILVMEHVGKPSEN
jgi:bla regulator protein blaR1